VELLFSPCGRPLASSAVQAELDSAPVPEDASILMAATELRRQDARRSTELHTA
jgi:hypothetical protein